MLLIPSLAIGRGVTPTAVPVSVAVPVPTPTSGEINIEGIDEENMKKLNEEIKVRSTENQLFRSLLELNSQYVINQSVYTNDRADFRT